jgi:hypothetical protein
MIMQVVILVTFLLVQPRQILLIVRLSGITTGRHHPVLQLIEFLIVQILIILLVLIGRGLRGG